MDNEEVAVTQDTLAKFRKTLTQVFSEAEIDELGRKTGQSKRRRLVTPFRLVLTLAAALADGIADLRPK